MSHSRSYERRVVLVMHLTWGFVFLDRMAQLYLAPYFAPELHISDAEVGLLAAAIAMSWAISSFCFGALADRVGYRAILIPMVFAFSALSIMSSFVHSFSMLLIVRVLMGIAEGPCWSIMNVIVQRASHPSRRGKNIGIVVSAAAVIGLAVAPVLTTQIAASFGWRAAFAVAGVPGVILGIVIWCFIDEPEREPVPARSHPGSRPGWRDLIEVARQRSIILCAVGAGGFIGWLTLTNAFAPLYITRVAGRDGATAGFLLGAAGLGSVVIGVVASHLSDRVGRRIVLSLVSAASLMLPLFLLVGPLYDHLWLLAALLFATQGGQVMSALLIVIVPSESVPARHAGAAIGWVTLVGEVLGATLMPSIGGHLAVTHGLSAPLLLAAASMSVVFVVTLALHEPGRTAVGDIVSPPGAA